MIENTQKKKKNIKKLGGVNGIQTNIFDERIFLTSWYVWNLKDKNG